MHEVTKYYAFNSQRIARRQDGVLTYLHTDHLRSTLLATNSSGTMVGEHRYRAYGSRRGGNELATDHRFTVQKLDGTGLYYDNARYYDPALGSRTLVSDYNRFACTRGNPLKYHDDDFIGSLGVGMSGQYIGVSNGDRSGQILITWGSLKLTKRG